MMHNSGMPSMAYYSYSAQPSPAEDSADQEFQFPTVTIPPRLKSIGRKISQMSNDFLPPGTPEDEEQKTFPSSPLARKADIPPVDDVPGMGDEPVMCPFCEKPLPPSLLAAQLTSGKGEHAHRNSSRQSQPPSSLRRTPSTRTGTPTPSAPLSRVTSATNPNATPASSSSRPQSSALEPKALLDALPVTTPDASTSKSVDPASLSPALPSASSESFAETVKEGDVANHTAAEKFITEDELKRWSTLSGISLPSTSSSVSKATSSSAAGAESQSRTEEAKPAPETKAFPLLPPPPPGGKLLKSSPSQASLRSDKAASGSSSRFNFFRRDSQQNNGAEDESDEDDDGVPASGYAKLTEPGSLSDSEGEEGLSRRIENARKKLESEKVQEQEQEAAKAPEQEAEETTEAQPSPVAGERDKKKGPAVREASEALSSGKDDEIRTVLQEVLGRINEMSQSQTALLASHSTLLTSLKIARSNLAMAEANSEMLEAQLKRISAAPPSASGSISRGPAGRNVSGPAATPGTPHWSLAPRASGEHVRTTTTANAVASPASTARTPARASMEERPRPMSLHVTASDLLNAGSSASAPSSANADSKSWGFWNGGKKKVAGAFNQIQIPASTSAIGGGGPPSRPGTPSAERASFDSSRPPVPFFSEPSGAPVARTIVRPTPTAHSNLSKSLNTQPGGLSRSMSTTNVPSQRSASGPAPVSSQELATLRQAYSAAVAKMDGMSKELAELKKGKVEMEAELENLSQALFEEANKMVADERRKRAEMEENLKEVREEREALKQTIKVLGGKVEDEDKDGGKGDHSEEIQVGKSGTGEDGEAKVEGAEEEGTTFVPRDLDKHYEALSKAIHHVSSGADLHSSQTIDNDAANNGSAATPFVAEPVPLTPSLGGIVPIPELGQAMNIPSISSSRTSTTDDSGLEFGRGKGVSMSLPAEANPWATSAGSAFSSSSTAAAATPLINVKAATPSPQPHLPGLPEMDLESELEKKEDKVDDKAGEGEAPSGLGLDIDKGVVAGIEEQKE